MKKLMILGFATALLAACTPDELPSVPDNNDKQDTTQTEQPDTTHTEQPDTTHHRAARHHSCGGTARRRLPCAGGHQIRRHRYIIRQRQGG